MLRDSDSETGIETARRPLLATLAAGGAAGLAGCSSLGDGVPVGDVAAANEVIFEGFTHSALGSASLNVERGDLVVSELDGGGDDGVRIDFGSVGAASVETAPFDFGIAGRRFGISGTGTVGGTADRSIGRVRLDSDGETIDALADYSDVGSEEVRLQVLDGSEVVAETVVPGGDVVATVEPGPDGLPRLDHCYKDITPDFPQPCYRPIFDRNGRVVAVDGTEGVGNRMRLLAETPDAGIDNIQSFSLTAAGASQFGVREVSVGLFGNLHDAIGDAVFDARYPGSLLRVGNVETGTEGVSVNFGGVQQAGVDFEPISLGQDGMRFTVSGTGTAGGEPGSPIGTAACRNNGGTVEAIADYSATGSDQVRIEVLDNGALVGRAIVPGGGVVATVEPGPDGPASIVECDKDLTEIDIETACYHLGLDRQAVVDPVEGERMTGDRVRLLADNPDVSTDRIDRFDFTGTGLGSLTIVGES